MLTVAAVGWFGRQPPPPPPPPESLLSSPIVVALVVSFCSLPILMYLLRGKAADSQKFSMLNPGSAAMSEHSLLLDPGSSNGLRLIAFSITAYVSLTYAVFTFTESTRGLSQHEHMACVLTLTLQIASLLHDAIARLRMSESERDTHRCVVAVKVLAALTNTMLCFMPSTPFIVDTITGRPNSMLRWAEWTTLAFTMTFIVEAIDSTEARTPILAAASQSLSTLCGLLLPAASTFPVVWVGLLVVSFTLYYIIFSRASTKRHNLQLMRGSLPPDSYGLVRAELGMRLLWQCVFTWSALTAVWTTDVIVSVFVARGATDWCFIADCAIDCVAKALYTTAIMEQTDTAALFSRTRKESRKRSKLHW